MLVSPLLLAAMDRWLLPRYADCGVTPMAEISEAQNAPVLIAGFGRFGQIIARVLDASGQSATVLDHNAEMIEAARRFGYKVFYGDASRLDLLRTAGAGQARILVIAVDKPEQSLAIAALAGEHFPQATIVARAFDAPHWHKMRDLGVQLVERELFEASLLSAQSVLELLGYSADAAGQTIRRFREYNQKMLETVRPFHQDQARLISAARESRRQLEELFAEQRRQAQQHPADQPE
jgi:glutathione-regulated potassium-efflux system ancillary protein KefC